MLVNVAGRGVVPCVNSLAPVRNVDLSEAQIRRILAFSFRVYDAATGLQINVKNINSFMAKGVQKEEAVVPAVEATPSTKKRASRKKEAPKAEPVIEETPVVVEEPVVEETVEEAPAVVEEVVDIVETAEESSVDVSIAPDESDEDVSAETTVEAPTYSKKKKKNRK